MEIEAIHYKDGKPSPVRFDRDDLDAMQALVGGLIEVVPLHGGKLMLVCNEEGKVNGLPMTAVATLGRGTGKWAEPIAGDFFIVREGGGNFLSVFPGDREELAKLVTCRVL